MESWTASISPWCFIPAGAEKGVAELIGERLMNLGGTRDALLGDRLYLVTSDINFRRLA